MPWQDIGQVDENRILDITISYIKNENYKKKDWRDHYISGLLHLLDINLNLFLSSDSVIYKDKKINKINVKAGN